MRIDPEFYHEFHETREELAYEPDPANPYDQMEEVEESDDDNP